MGIFGNQFGLWSKGIWYFGYSMASGQTARPNFFIFNFHSSQGSPSSSTQNSLWPWFGEFKVDADPGERQDCSGKKCLF